MTVYVCTVDFFAISPLWVNAVSCAVGWCGLQITGEIERSDIPYEGDESFEGELSEDVSQDRDQDVGDDVITVGQLDPVLTAVDSESFVTVVYTEGEGVMSEVDKCGRGDGEGGF